MALPTRTQTMNDSLLTLDTYIKSKPVDVTFEPRLLAGAFLSALNQKGAKSLMGTGEKNIYRRNGRDLLLPVRYGRSSNTQAFRGMDTLNTNKDTSTTFQSEVFSNYTDFAAQDWEEAQENKGDVQEGSIWQARVDQMMDSIGERVEGDMWSTNSTSTNPDEIRGLQHLVAISPSSGTVWGIDRSTNSWHRNNSVAVTSTFASVGLSSLATGWNAACANGGGDRPTAGFTTSILWNAYMAEAEDIHRITIGREAELSYDVATYRGSPVTWSSDCPSGYWYQLNMKYGFMVVRTNPFYTEYPEKPNDQLIANQVRIVFSAQWGFERYDRQTVISGFTDT